MTKKRNLALVLCLVLVTALVSVGGTIAWITTKTTPVVNTFTVGDINITLGETTTTYKMIPGKAIAKDPKVTVKAGSEECWLFVEIEESSNFDDYMTWTIASDWTLLESASSDDKYVYYRTVNASTADQEFKVLNGDKVTVLASVTKAELEAVKTSNQPTLTFTAYAVQKDNITNVNDAWTQAQTAVVPSTSVTQ